MQHRIAIVAASAAVLVAQAAGAYTSAGDRIFPATIQLPQIAPSDELYITPGTLPQSGGGRDSGVSFDYDKTITERLGIGVGGEYSWNEEGTGPTLYGWQNFTTNLQYLAVQDADHEFLLSVGGEREWGGTGAARVGASPLGATTFNLYTGKGFGDVAPPLMQPFAVEGVFGYTKSDGTPRPDLMNAGLALEYSIPYLESKVSDVPLPAFARNLTPIVEYVVSTPTGSGYGTSTTSLVAPGVTYSGTGWEFGVEAQIPTTRATGRGVGVVVQFHVSFDYFFPETLGRPIFGGPY